MEALNLTGIKYGKPTVLYQCATKNSKRLWACLCDCGVYTRVTTSNLRTGNSTQCRKCGYVSSTKKHIKHNKSHTHEHDTWIRMFQLCENTNNPLYKYYGAKGITVCEKWHDFMSFFSDIGPMPQPNYRLTRIDKNKNFEPFNCIWSPPKSPDS